MLKNRTEIQTINVIVQEKSNEKKILKQLWDLKKVKFESTCGITGE